MKIMYFVPCDVIGGAEKQLEYLIKQIKSTNSVGVAYISPHIEPWIKTLGVQAYRVFSPNTLARTITSFKPNVFQFFHSAMAYSALKKVNPRPKIVEVIHNRHHFGFDATTYPKDLTDVCVCVSTDAEENFLMCCPGIKTLVIPNGVDTTRFNTAIRAPLKDKVGGYAGRLEGGDGKGIASLIRIMSKLPVKFEFVGQDLAGWRPEIEKHPNLKWYPHTNTPEAYYAKWDFFVSMSPNEGFGLSIAEAISCGIPSIVYDCGGVTNYLEHGKHAMIAKSDEDVVSFIKTINKFKPKPIDLSDTAMAKEYIELYEELVGIERRVEVRTKVNVLGTCPSSWSGVRHAISKHVDEFCDISNIQRYLKTHNVDTLYFGGFMPEWAPILHLAKKTGAETIVSIHHTPLLGEFNKINTSSLVAVVKEYKLGNITRIESPSLVISKVFNRFGVECHYNPNQIERVPADIVPLSGINIGIFGSGMPWKNLETQVIAAALYAKTTTGVKIHTQSPISDLCRELGIEVVVHPQMPRDRFLKLAGSMTINMAIGMTETFGYFAVESFLVGAPCLWSVMTPSMRGSGISECEITCIDDPTEIEHHIKVVIENRADIVKRGQVYLESAHEKD
jgi:glycosyltransferase involved in cell wall biosynthesis